MIIDFHTHIFPKKVREDRESLFPGEPAFNLLYESKNAGLASAGDTVEMMDDQGVDISVVFGFPWQDAPFTKLHNDYILKSVSRHPDRLIGFCCVDPYNDSAPKEVQRCIDQGLSGVGELAFYQSGIDGDALERLSPIMEICRQADCPILIHTNEPVGHLYPGKTPNTLKQIYDLIRRFPDNKLVLAHWGGGIFFYSLLKKEVRNALHNVWYDTAASPYLYRSHIYRVAGDLVGTDKILFGTDYPLLKPERYFKELDEADLGRGDIDKICGGNALELLNLQEDIVSVDVEVGNL